MATAETRQPDTDLAARFEANAILAAAEGSRRYARYWRDEAAKVRASRVVADAEALLRTHSAA